MEIQERGSPRVARTYMLGPLGGLLVAVVVLAASFALGRESGLEFLKGLAVVFVAAGIAVSVVMFLASHFGRAIFASVLEDVSQKPAGTIDASTEGLALVLERLETVLDRQIYSLSRFADLSDADLARIETSEATREVVICRREMGPEFVGAEESPAEFLAAVTANIARGVRYRWLTEDNAVSRQREHVVRELFETDDDQIIIKRLDPDVWERLPFALETVFYRQLAENGAHHLVGFTDVSFTIDDRRMWRRLSERYCTTWYDAVEQQLSLHESA